MNDRKMIGVAGETEPTMVRRHAPLQALNAGTMVRLAIAIALAGIAGGYAFAAGKQADDETVPPTVSLQNKGDYRQMMVRKLPCKAGSFHTRVTVKKLLPGKMFETGAVVRIESKQEGGRVLTLTTEGSPFPPLTVRMFDWKNHEIKSLRGNPKVGVPISVDISWTTSAVTFFVDHQAQWTYKLRDPFELILMATGSITVFDQNTMDCQIIS